MAHRVRWAELGFGIVSAASVLAAALLILLFGRVGQLHGKKFTLYVTTDAARGIVRGSEVWLDGQRVGSVDGVDFQSALSSPKNRLVIALRVLEDARPHLRRDSKVVVRAGLNVIGDQVVYLSSGTLGQREIAEGDTLRATEQTDMEGMTSEAALAAKQFPGIIENVKLLGAQLRSAQSTLGALGADRGNVSLRPLRARTTELLESFGESKGTVGLAIHDASEWRAKAAEALASADTLRLLVGSERHSLGRFRRDTTLTEAVSTIRNQIAALQALAVSPTGAIGRWHADSAIVRALQRDKVALDSLMADIKRRPLRYIAF
jgi:phospholipid/cholesterol/gamma-HCH transport system substrate-binding protein